MHIYIYYTHFRQQFITYLTFLETDHDSTITAWRATPQSSASAGKKIYPFFIVILKFVNFRCSFSKTVHQFADKK